MINYNLKNITFPAIAKAFFLMVICLWCLPAHAQKPETDTFKIAKKYMAKKKYNKAYRYLNHYHKHHPNDLNAIWLEAQTKLYSNNFRQSDSLYKGALKLHPDNDYLRLDYIHSLLDMGKNETAGSILNSMDKDGKDYSDMSFLYAQLYYWEGNYVQASAYMKKALEQDSKNKEWNDLNDELQLARSPKISLNTSYITDNQPLSAVISSLKFENYFGRLLNVYISCDEYHFLQNNVSDAPWLTIGDKLFFPRAGIQLNVGAGISQFPVKNEVGFSGHLGITKKISQQFDIEVAGERVPYFDTKTSIDTDITATKLSGMLNWHRRGWKAQAAFLSSIYDNNSYVYSAYAWVMAPVYNFRTGQLNIGYSSGYSNSNVNSYTYVNPLSEVLATPANEPISGIYSPYFTPNNQFINAALLSFNLKIVRNLDLAVNGDIGYGAINNPYLFLDKNSAGNLFVNKGYSVENFVPGDASVAFNYHIDKTWLLQAKYVYRTTYFFTSNYVGIGIEKSFQNRRIREPKQEAKSAFSKRVQEIEEKIQSLYNCRNAVDLKQSVNKIKDQLVALRDEQKMLKNTSEILPNSERAALLQDRYDNLNEMVDEFNSVNLDDNKDNAVSKSEWLVDKLYELTSISYNGDLQE